MTYLSFLALFLALPLLAVGLLTWFDQRHRIGLESAQARLLAWRALLAHVGLAVAYTTPWDNYLVAARVWWYDPARVLGVTLGWVPLEEYLFFVLQTLLTGLLLFALARRLPQTPRATATKSGGLRWASVLVVTGGWLLAVASLALGWAPATYLGLILAWALPPIALQLAVGADILWRHRRSVLTTLFGVTAYLCAADFVALGVGVWTIDPAQSLGLLLGGVLPIEEAVFFLMTNTLLVFGLTLALAPETWRRWARLTAALRRRPAQENA